METKVNLVEILKDAPKGLKLWEDTLGEVIFVGIDESNKRFPISIKGEDYQTRVTKTGAFHIGCEDDMEDIYPCVLWPCESHRSWENWQMILFKAGDILVKDGVPFRLTAPGDASMLLECRWATEEEREQFFGNKTAFKPFDKVLVRDNEFELWVIDLFDCYVIVDESPYYCMVDRWKYCIPFEGNENLLGTTNAP